MKSKQLRMCFRLLELKFLQILLKLSAQQFFAF